MASVLFVFRGCLYRYFVVIANAQKGILCAVGPTIHDYLGVNWVASEKRLHLGSSLFPLQLM